MDQQVLNENSWVKKFPVLGVINLSEYTVSEDESSVLFYNYILWKGRNFSTESSPLWNGKKIGCQNLWNLCKSMKGSVTFMEIVICYYRWEFHKTVRAGKSLEIKLSQPLTVKTRMLKPTEESDKPSGIQ